MDKLHKYYRTAVKSVIVLLFSTLAVLYVLSDVNEFINDSSKGNNSTAYVLSILIHTLAPASLYFLVEKLIINVMWKVLYPNINFHGSWIGFTVYKTNYYDIPDNKNKSHQVFVSQHSVYIKQDCFSIQVSDSRGNDFITWHSVVADIVDEKMQFLYKVNYTESKDENERVRLKGEAYGYELMASDKSDTKNKLPTTLTGTFYHCLSDIINPKYIGETIFIKNTQKSLDNIFKNGVPPPFNKYIAIEENKLIIKPEYV